MRAGQTPQCVGERKDEAVCFTLILLLFLLWSFPYALLAQPIDFERTIVAETTGGAPIVGATIIGNNGLGSMPGAFTGNSGTFSFDIRDLSSLHGLLAGVRRSGFIFTPSLLELSKCIGGVCTFQATPSPTGSFFLRVLVQDQYSRPVENVRVMVGGADTGTPRLTDGEGISYFVLPVRQGGGCNSTNSNPADDHFTLLLDTNPNSGCTVAAPHISVRRLCPGAEGSTDIVVQATCPLQAPSPLSPLQAGRYSLPVIADDGAQLFTQLMLYPGGFTTLASVGGGSFNLQNYGFHPTQSVIAVPVGPAKFFPPFIELSQKSCPGGRCQAIRAVSVPNSLTNLIFPVRIVDEGGEGVSGVSVKIAHPEQWVVPTPQITDENGRIYIPSRLMECAEASQGIKIHPSLPEFTFHHDEEFFFCPRTPQAEFVATAVQNEDTEIATLKGQVLNAQNEPFPRVAIKRDGTIAAITDSEGRFNLQVLKGTSLSIRPEFPNIIFDKEAVEINAIRDSLLAVTFQMVGTADGDPFGDGNAPCHNAVAGQVTVQGAVINEEGEPVSGATVYNNGEVVTTSGGDGSYSFQAPQGTNVVVTVEDSVDRNFIPASITYPIHQCDIDNANFQVSDDEYTLVAGEVRNLQNGSPLSGVEVVFSRESGRTTVQSDENGYYEFRIPAGSSWNASPDQLNFDCSPGMYVGEGDTHQTNANFLCVRDECPEDDEKLSPGACGCGALDTDTDGDGTPDCNDLCPSNRNKIAPGSCGCGVADIDSDGDGVLSCNEQCPNDPQKITPGVCGCGVADIDSDGDGTPDCNDQCQNDPLKVAPGQCGCGKVDTDTDKDGVADCVDLCPADSGKVAPGGCGCGVLDTDSDSDGTPNCNDQCPNDSNKVAPGTCGCGVADTDSDSDGTPNCNDQCPNDSKKLLPGLCGCGSPDIDSDGDGTLDCKEQCPSDPLKLLPGVCGCGFADTDSDGDKILDCNDLCPLDPLKSAPGQCGCGAAETDSDGDGVADCKDQCATDSKKSLPGKCGCGVAETDSDKDGTPDCIDECSSDPNKIKAGVCGCGVSDADSDKDGTLDCQDFCPNDPNKLEAGACGCGVRDVDTDQDGTLDCKDLCPNDRAKVAPGSCGCGISDADSDRDGVIDCQESCPNDPLKIAPGICGCGIADTDSDKDGVADCKDSCPVDPLKTAAGQCGCGVVDTDSDKDGIADCVDQCVADPKKSLPGVCGCGTADTDTDGDGTPNCKDQCPNDRQKLLPGACGCGIADTDTDSDGTPNCSDQCPSDRTKILPGICGCGKVDSDSDGDGTLDCFDGCPSDPLKLKPGSCGCSVVDTDTDGDGTPNCNDLCPSDSKKSAPGQCGCGNSDGDSDGDGVSDCVDLCAADSLKSAPGVCGCGVADSDRDSDGTPDCNDQCPNDANKLVPGQCGCGFVDRDRDGDGILDCFDGCPIDRAKAAPGVCGCGVPDIDTDGDGTPNCLDLCPTDNKKTAAGECGCGVVEEDKNGNGLTDCKEVNLELRPVCLSPFAVTPPEQGAPPQVALCNNGATEMVEAVVGSGTVPSSQQNPLNALGAPDGESYALGRGGAVIFGFSSNAVWNLLGFDLLVVTDCTDGTARGVVSGSRDGVNWTTLGVVTCDGGDIDLNAGSMGYASYLRIEDDSTGGSSGLVIDGIGCIGSDPTTEGLMGMAPIAGLKNEKKVTICHIPPGNPGNAHTLSVSESAVPAHLAHGDTLGPCGATPPPNPSPTPNPGAPEDPEEPELPPSPPAPPGGENPPPAMTIIGWQMINRNSVDIEGKFRYQWQPGSTELHISSQDDVIVWTNINPDPRMLLSAYGVVHDEETHPLRECRPDPESFVLSASIKGRNGRPLSGRLKRLLNKGRAVIIARHVRTKEVTEISLEDPYVESQELPIDDYLLTIRVPGSLKVISRPVKWPLRAEEILKAVVEPYITLAVAPNRGVSQ